MNDFIIENIIISTINTNLSTDDYYTVSVLNTNQDYTVHEVYLKDGVNRYEVLGYALNGNNIDVYLSKDIDTTYLVGKEIELTYRLTFNNIKVFNTVDEMIIQSLPVGSMVYTKGYSTVGDKGNGVYLVSVDGYIDNIGLGFELPNGNVAQLITENYNTAQFGVFPDGITFWESTHNNRISAMFYAATLKPLHFLKGLYKTTINLSNKHSNSSFVFEEGSELGGVLHIISSDSIISKKNVSQIVDNGDHLVLTTSTNHGATTERFLAFQGTETSLDGQKILATVLTANTLRLDISSFSGTLNTSGFIYDYPLENVTIKGTITIYDRFGTINARGVYGNFNILCKSDATKNPLGDEGRGVHIYSASQSFFINSIVVENNENQITAQTNQAAVGIDGSDFNIGSHWTVKNIFIKEIIVKDCQTNGVLIQGEGHQIGLIDVQSFGGDTTNFASSIAYMQYQSYTGFDIRAKSVGVIFFDTDAKVDRININQPNVRTTAEIQVLVDRALLNNSYSYPRIGEIICSNVRGTALEVGVLQRHAGVYIGKMVIKSLSADNLLINNSTERAVRGLVNADHCFMELGHLLVKDQNVTTILRRTDRSFSGTDKQFNAVTINTLQTHKISPYVAPFSIGYGTKINTVLAFGSPNNKASFVLW